MCKVVLLHLPFNIPQEIALHNEESASNVTYNLRITKPGPWFIWWFHWPDVKNIRNLCFFIFDKKSEFWREIFELRNPSFGFGKSIRGRLPWIQIATAAGSVDIRSHPQLSFQSSLSIGSDFWAFLGKWSIYGLGSGIDSWLIFYYFKSKVSKNRSISVRVMKVLTAYCAHRHEIQKHQNDFQHFISFQK